MGRWLVVLVLVAGCGPEVAPALCDPGEKRCVGSSVRTCGLVLCEGSTTEKCLGWAAIQTCGQGRCVPDPPPAHCSP